MSIRVLEDSTRKDDPTTTAQLTRDYFYPHSIFAEQLWNVGEPEVGAHIFRPLTHLLPTNNAPVVLQTADIHQPLRVAPSRFNVFHHLAHPIWDKARNQPQTRAVFCICHPTSPNCGIPYRAPCTAWNIPFQKNDLTTDNITSL